MRKIGIKNFRKFVSESEEPDPGDYELLRKVGAIQEQPAAEFRREYLEAMGNLSEAVEMVKSVFDRTLDQFFRLNPDGSLDEAFKEIFDHFEDLHRDLDGLAVNVEDRLGELPDE